MDGFEVLHLHHVSADSRQNRQGKGHITHQIFDELGVVVGALGHEFLVGALQQTVDLARGVLLGNSNQRLDIQRFNQVCV